MHKLLIILYSCPCFLFGAAQAAPISVTQANLGNAPRTPWKMLWQTQLSHSDTDLFWNSPPVAPPVESQGVLLVPTAQGRQWVGLTGLRATDGKALWSFPLASVADLVPDGQGHVFCSSPQGIKKIEVATGRTIADWQPDVGLSGNNYLGRAGPGYLILTGSVLVAFWDYGRVAGLSPETGAVLWVKHWWPEPGRTFGVDHPCAIQGRVFFEDCVDACVRAFKAETGAVIWTRNYSKDSDAPENTFTAQPSEIADKMILIPAQDRLDLVRAADGTLLRTAPRPKFGTALVAWATGCVEYDTQSHSAVWLLPTMRLSPAKLPPDYFDAMPAADGTLLYALNQNEVTALDFRTGKQRSRCRMTTGLSNVIVVGRRTLFVVTTAGLVSALPRLHPITENATKVR